MITHMLTPYVTEYYNVVVKMMQEVLQKEENNIEWVAEKMTAAIMNGKSIFVFGPSHAGMFAEEFFYRAGGLAVTNPLFHSGMMLDTRPVTLTSDMECLPGYASIILNESPLKAGDFLLIHSVAARNPVVIEMAIKAKAAGIDVAAVINMEYATQVTSRDPSGKMLYEVVERVIDTHGCYGDSCIEIHGMAQKVAPASTPISAFIANALLLQTCQNLLDKGIEPPVFQSANVDGGAEYNAELFKRFADQIHYMR